MIYEIKGMINPWHEVSGEKWIEYIAAQAKRYKDAPCSQVRKNYTVGEFIDLYARIREKESTNAKTEDTA